MNRAARALVGLAAVASAWAGPPAHEALAPAPHRAQVAALVMDPDIAEVSGMAASHRSERVLWVLNDSGNGERLYALGQDGRVRSVVTVAGVRNHDWEDLAGWQAEGRSYLLIADTGDNGGLRREIELIALAEPDPALRTQTVTPLWRLRARWPDGPRDCEAVAVDAAAGQILLMAKKRVPAQLFALPLGPPVDPDAVLVATQIASVPTIPQPDAAELAAHPEFGRYRSQVTAMDLAPDGRMLAVLTYRDAYLYARRDGEAWRDALARPPLRLGMPALPQAEAIAFDRDGRRLWVTTERLPAPLIRFDPK